MKKEEITEKMIVDFCKSLQKAKIMRAGSHKDKKVISLITEIAGLNEKELKIYATNPNVMMIHDEFTDWVETYKAA